jgi:hypothetical protein
MPQQSQLSWALASIQTTFESDCNLRFTALVLDGLLDGGSNACGGGGRHVDS